MCVIVVLKLEIWRKEVVGIRLGLLPLSLDFQN